MSLLPSPPSVTTGRTSLVAKAGLAAGTLDLCLAALIQVLVAHRINVPRILQSIASGLLGRASFDGGARSAALGLVLHYLIAAIWAGIFLAVVARSALVSRLIGRTRGLVGAGLAYGVVVWAGMHFIVVPLSRASSNMRFTWVTALMIAGHALLVGLPIVLVIGPGYRRRTPPIEPA